MATNYSDFESQCGTGGSNLAGAPCQAYIRAKNTTIVADQVGRKNAAITNTISDAQRVFEADKNAAFAYLRGEDLKRAQSIVNDVNANQGNSIKRDLDISKRQFEINEYHYYNKLDTLFFLQVLFITVIVMAILMYFNRRGTLTTKMTGMITTILAILLVIVGVSRYFYTMRTRDTRLWHRRYFQTEKEPRPDLISSCPGPTSSTTINLNALFDKEDISCIQDTSAAYTRWKDSVNTEAKTHMEGGDISSVFSQYGIEKPASCKRK